MQLPQVTGLPLPHCWADRVYDRSVGVCYDYAYTDIGLCNMHYVEIFNKPPLESVRYGEYIAKVNAILAER